jgi:phosphatidate cytidylyltransferase
MPTDKTMPAARQYCNHFWLKLVDTLKRKNARSRMGETPKRLISGLTLAGMFIFCISWQGMYMFPLYLFVMAFAILGIIEFYKLAEAKIGTPIPKTLGVISTIVLMTLVYLGWQANYYVKGMPLYNESIKNALNLLKFNYALLGGLAFVFLFSVMKVQLLKNRVENSLLILAVYTLSVIYIPFTFSHVFLLYSLEHGLFYVWIVAWATAMADTGGYFMGRTFGRNKVGFAVSPNKTYEGYILGGFMQIGLVILFYFVAKAYFTVPEYSYVEIGLFGFVTYLASILGDLSESLIKRDAGIKDSGSLIPGHGGVLDLLDAMLITIPAAYYYFYVVQELRRI